MTRRQSAAETRTRRGAPARSIVPQSSRAAGTQWPAWAVTLVALFAVGLTASSAHAQISFTGPTTYGVGPGPNAMAAGDLNGDGHVDFVTSHANSPFVSVLLGSASGAFTGPTNFAAGFSLGLALGDVNNDGRLDAIVADGVENRGLVLLGDGDGTFSAGLVFVTGVDPLGVATADFNRDGNLDLAVGNDDSNTVSILLGTGTGTFATPTNLPADNGPRSLATGDLNGDGNPDLLVSQFFGGGLVRVKLGDGLGGFSDAPGFSVGLGPSSLAIGDLNGDGTPDVAVTNAASNTVSVVLGDGTGGFSAPTNYPVGGNPYSVAMGDLDGDGDPDLAVANRTGDTISILAGDGAGQFSAATNLLLADGPAALAIVDVNGDGKLDVAVATNASNTVAILLNTTTGVVNHPPVATSDVYVTPEGTPLNVAGPGVLDNDSDADGDAIAPELVSAPSHGALTLNANGSFSYTPAAGYSGADSFSYQATDGRLRSNTVTVTITVQYRFAGFFQPVDNAPVLNRVNGGQSVPLMFSLGGNKGPNILASGYPLSQPIACSGGASVDDIEQTDAPGTSTLTYDAVTDRYRYSWKTQKAWKNTCRQLTVRLSDGTDHVALFQFK